MNAAAPFCVVDVGASGGLHPRWARTAPGHRAVLFEPDPREFESLRKKLPANHVLINAGLSDHRGEAELHLCRKQETSSFHAPNAGLLARFPEAGRFDVVERRRLSVDTLDAQLEKAGVADPDFIKLDVQGHELAVLSGADRALRRVVGVEVEVEFQPLYVGQPLFPEVHAFLSDRGFELFDLKKSAWRRRGPLERSADRGQLVFGDALYFRPPEAVALLDGGKILNAVTAYLAYACGDSAWAAVEAAAGAGHLSPEAADGAKRKILASIGRRLPEFPGKYRLYKLMKRLADVVKPGQWHWSDAGLGRRGGSGDM